MNTRCSTWVAELMIQILKEIGFSEVKKVQFEEGIDTGLCKGQESKTVGSLYIRQKTVLAAI